MSPPASSPLRPSVPQPDLSRLVRRHLSFGWWSLLVFLVLGIGLEALHGFKAPWYLNDAYSARRLLWTLAHAHGVLLALINVVFAIGLRTFAPESPPTLVSRCLLGASVLVPAGFALGGIDVRGGDPGLGIILLPIGAALLVVAVFLIARAARSDSSDP
jgi:hypothetical protein